MTAAINGALLVLAPTNLLALLAIGLFARQYGMRTSVVLTFVFAVGFTIGALVIASAVRNYPAVETQLGLAIVAGVFAAAAYRPPGFVAGILIFAAGEALALNTPPQAITLSGAAISQIASGITGAALFLLVALISRAAEGGWRTIALRVVSSWIAASALLAFALRLAR